MSEPKPFGPKNPRIISNKVAFIIATKDRPEKLSRLFKSLDTQTRRPDQVIIIDSGSLPLQKVIDKFPDLVLSYSQFFPPSATKQRNFGLTMLRPEITLVGFLDDDVELDKFAVENLLFFWEEVPMDLAGTALNMMNHPGLFASSLKNLPLAERLGLYSRIRGDVLPSAFQTMIGRVKDNMSVKWLPTGAVVWRREIFENFTFDEWFRDYSYLEDLDFSYRVGKKYKLMVLSDARYFHYPAISGRGSDFKFGFREVENRLYLARKFKEFSLVKSYLALLMRLLINLGFFLQKNEYSYFKRAAGNVAGLMSSLVRF